MRSLGISVLSLVLTTIVIANAYYQKKQFYPSVVYITKSNPSMAVSIPQEKHTKYTKSILPGHLYSSFYMCLTCGQNHEKNLFWPTQISGV